MNKKSKLRLLLYTAPLVSLLTVFVAIRATTRQSQPGSGSPAVKAINKTTSIQILSVSKVGEGVRAHLEVKLQNRSSNNILACTISMGGPRVISLYFPFPPGETRVEKLSLGTIEAAAANNPSHSEEITVSAVYMSGAVVEGDPKDADDLQQQFKGIRAEVEHELPILRAALNSQQSPEEILQSLAAQEPPSSSRSDEVESSREYGGRAMIKNHLQDKLRELQDRRNAHPGYDHREDLNNMVAFYEKMLSIM